MSNSAKWLRVLVSDMSSGKSKTNVKIPAGMVKFGLKMATKYAPDAIGGLDMDQLMEAMKNGEVGRLVEVEDEEKGERVEVFIE